MSALTLVFTFDLSGLFLLAHTFADLQQHKQLTMAKTVTPNSAKPPTVRPVIKPVLSSPLGILVVNESSGLGRLVVLVSVVGGNVAPAI